MSKHTPGPWQALTFSNHELQTDFAMVAIGKRAHIIGYSEEDQANARLIAAAPDLLQVLEQIVATCDHYDAHGDGLPLGSLLYSNALIAITKAKGEDLSFTAKGEA